MRRSWALTTLVLLTLQGSALADPVISRPGPLEGLAEWNFSNPANYTLDNATLVTGGTSLRWSPGWAGDTTLSDFSSAVTKDNVDLMGSPGEVLILNTSQQGPIQTSTFQPSASNISDNYLNNGKKSVNFGTAADLHVGNWGGGEFNRGLLQFPVLPVPANATLLSVSLQMYMYSAPTAPTMTIGIFRVPTSWTEFGSTWDTRDGINPWNNSGGDFVSTGFDPSVPVGSTVGWYTWNITALVNGWWTRTYLNQGMMVRQVDDTTNALGQKDFYSSDGPNASLGPRLFISYTTLSSFGLLESRTLGPGTLCLWGSIWWNETLPAGTSITLETRSGNSSTDFSSWSPWTSPYATPDLPVRSPPARFLEYRVLLFTPSTFSPDFHDATVTFGRYQPLGRVVTEALLPKNLSSWGRFDAAWNGAPTSGVSFEYSQDNGSSWAVVTAASNLTSALSKAITIRVTFTTGDTTQAPLLHTMSLGFLLVAGGDGGGGGQPQGQGLPWWLLLLSLAALIALPLARSLLRHPYRPTDLLLIHTDGRLVMRVGGKESPLQDELAVSGMFTLVAQFVKDSFGGATGGGGELKSIRVDQREVSIAKGEYLFLALVAEGTRPEGLEDSMMEFLRSLEASQFGNLRTWDGLRSSLGNLEGDLHWFLEHGYTKAHPHAAARDSGPR